MKNILKAERTVDFDKARVAYCAAKKKRQYDLMYALEEIFGKEYLEDVQYTLDDLKKLLVGKRIIKSSWLVKNTIPFRSDIEIVKDEEIEDTISSVRLNGFASLVIECENGFKSSFITDEMVTLLRSGKVQNIDKTIGGGLFILFRQIF